MSKKEFFLLVDSETTINGKVFDFGAIVADRQGKIHHSVAAIVQESTNETLFYDNSNAIWSRKNAEAKREAYAQMVKDGRRIVVGAAGINRWLDKVQGKYDPMLTAYNLAFDADKCEKTGIDLNNMAQRFCLWHTACAVFANTKQYKKFILDNHYIGNRTAKGNMTYTTNAQVMAHFVTGEFKEEPHTAMEDAMHFELPILQAIVKRRGWKKEIGKAYNWRNYQVKNNFKA